MWYIQTFYNFSYTFHFGPQIFFIVHPDKSLPSLISSLWIINRETYGVLSPHITDYNLFASLVKYALNLEWIFVCFVHILLLCRLLRIGEGVWGLVATVVRVYTLCRYGVWWNVPSNSHGLNLQFPVPLFGYLHSYFTFFLSCSCELPTE